MPRARGAHYLLDLYECDIGELPRDARFRVSDRGGQPGRGGLLRGGGARPGAELHGGGSEVVSLKRKQARPYCENMEVLPAPLADVRNNGNTLAWELYAVGSELTRCLMCLGHLAAKHRNGQAMPH